MPSGAGVPAMSTSLKVRQSKLEFSERIHSGDDNEEITIYRNPDRIDPQRGRCGNEGCKLD